MAYDIEDKVVQMRFDNRDFDPNIDASIKSLEKLEKSLKLANGTKGLEDVEKQAKKFNLDPAITAVESLKKGFSAMEIVAITAISNITNKAMVMGSRIVQAFAIDPLRSGFSEYSEQMNSTQVIMSNTGDTLQDVTAALDELNIYADKTIYSFGQMTQAIGKFAAAGVELGPATKAIQGLSSAAATVGANNQQLFSAYYNLAQSLQLGYMQLIDWKSLETSTIGNKTMRTALIKTAEEMGKFTDATTTAEAAYADFRGSLSKKWLTSDVIITTLNNYSRNIQQINDETKGLEWTFEELGEDGSHLNYFKEGVKSSTGEVLTYIDEMNNEVEAWKVEIAATAHAAATEIKSFKQMWETLTEAAGTGWAETWKIIFGDLEQSKKLWTGIGNSIEKVITFFTDLRNKALEAWNAVQGREDLIAGLQNIADGFKNLMLVIGKTLAKLMGVTEDSENGFEAIGNVLQKVTRTFRIFTEAIMITDDEVDKLSDTLYTFLEPLKLIYKIVSFLVKVFLSVIVITVAIFKTILLLINNITLLPELFKEIFGEEVFEGFKQSLKELLKLFEPFGIILEIISDVGAVVYLVIQRIGEALAYIVGYFSDSTTEGYKFVAVFGWIRDVLVSVLYIIHELLVGLRDLLENGIFTAGTAFSGAANSIKDFMAGILSVIKDSKTVGLIKRLGAFLGNALVSGFRGPDGIDANSPAKTSARDTVFYVLGILKTVKKSVKTVTKSGAELGEALNNGTIKALNVNKKKATGSSKDIEEAIATPWQILTKTIEEVYNDATLSTLQKIGKTIAAIGTFFGNILNGISFSKVIIGAFAIAIVGFIFMITHAIHNVAEALEGLEHVLNGISARLWAEAFDQIGQALFNIAKALALITLIAAWNPEGLKAAVVVLGIFMAAMTALVVVFSRLITVGDKLKALGNGLSAVKSFGKVFAQVFSLTSVAVVIFAMAGAILMLSRALATLSELDTKSMYKGLVVLEILMWSMVGIIIILSKFATQLSFGTLVVFAFSYGLKLFSNAIANIGGDFTDNIQKLTEMTTKEVIVLTGLILGLTILSVYLNKASFVLSKVILSLSVLAMAFGLMGFMLGIFKDNPVLLEIVQVVTNWQTLVPFVFSFIAIVTTLIIAFSVFNKTIKKYNARISATDTANKLSQALKNLSGGILKTGFALGLIAAAIAVVYHFAGPDTTKVLWSAVAAMGAMIAGLFTVIGAIVILSNVLSKSDLNSESFESMAKLMRTLTKSLFSLVISTIAVIGIMMLFWRNYQDDPEMGVRVLVSSLAAVVTLAGAVAGLVVAIGRNVKGDNAKGVLIGLIPVLGLVMELMIALALFSTIEDWHQLAMGVAAIHAVMAPLIGLVAVLGKFMTESTTIKTKSGDMQNVKKVYANIASTLVTVMVSVSIIFAEVAAFSILITKFNVNMQAVIEAAGMFFVVLGGIVALLTVLSHFTTQLSNTQYSTNNGKMLSKILNQVMGIIITIGAVLATLGGSLYLINISKRETDAAWEVPAIIGSMVFLISAIMAAITMILKHLNKFAVNNSDLIKMGSIVAAIIGSIVAIAGTIYLLKDVPLNVMGIIAAGMLGFIASMGAMIFGLVRFTNILNGSWHAILNAGFFALMLSGSLSIFALAMVGIMKTMKDLDIDVEGLDKLSNIMFKFLGFAMAYMIVSELLSKKFIKNNKNSNGFYLGITNDKTRDVSKDMIKLAAAMSILSAAMWTLSLIPTDRVNGVINLFTVMSVAMGLMGTAFGILSRFIDPNKVKAVALSLILMSSAMSILSVSMVALSSIPADQIWNIVKLLVAMVIALGILAGAAIGLGHVAQYALLGSLVINLLSVAMLVAAAAITKLANAPLSKLAVGLSIFSNEKVINGMWAFIGAFTVFSIACVIFSIAVPAIALGFAVVSMSIAALVAVLAKAIEVIGTSGKALVDFVNAMADVKLEGITALSVLIGSIGIALKVAAPGFILLAVAIGIVLVAFGAFLGLATPALVAMNSIVLALKDSAIALFNAVVDRLQDIVNVLNPLIDKSQQFLTVSLAFVALSASLFMLGMSGVIAAGAVYLLAKAIDELMKVMLKPEFLGLKDVMITLIKEVLAHTEELQKLSDIIADLGGAIIIFGLGLLASSLGILAFAGAMTVLKNAFVGKNEDMGKLITGLADSITLFFRKGGEMAALGAAFFAFGVGLTIFGGGLLAISIGILALTASLAIFNNLMPAIEKMLTWMIVLSTISSKIKNLAKAFFEFGLSLLVVAPGFFAISFTIGAFITILMLTAAVCTTIVMPAIMGITLALGQLALAIVPAINTMTGLTTALTDLAKEGSLIEIGQGLLLIAGAFFALGLVSVILTPLIPLILLVTGAMTLVSQILKTLSTAIVEFTQSLLMGSEYISRALATISMAFIIAMNNIRVAVTDMLNLLLQLSSIDMTDLVGGLFAFVIGVTAIAGACIILAPVITIILLLLLVLTAFTVVLNIVSTAITNFATNLETASVSISNAMTNISTAFLSSVLMIKAGIMEIIDLASQGILAANDFIDGFCHTLFSGQGDFFDAAAAGGNAAVEGIRSREGIDAHSDAWTTIMAAKDFIGGFCHTLFSGQGSFFDAAAAGGKAAVEGINEAVQNGSAGWFYNKQVGTGKKWGEKLANNKIVKGIAAIKDVVTGKTNIGDAASKIFGEDSAIGKAVKYVKGLFTGELDFGDLAKKLGLGDLGSMFDNLTDSVSGLGDAAGATNTTMGSLTSTLKNQMKIFERFTADEEMIKPAELINNMKSQLRGMQNWASGLDMLVARGISGPLLQYLSEMGPEGYKYVEAFLAMTEDEFAQANELYSESLDMPEAVAEGIVDNYKQLGIDIVEGTKEGYSSAGGFSGTGIPDDTIETVENTGIIVQNTAGHYASATLDELTEMATAANEKWAMISGVGWMTAEDAGKWIAAHGGLPAGYTVDYFGKEDVFRALADTEGKQLNHLYGEMPMDVLKANEKAWKKSSGDFWIETANGQWEAVTGTDYVSKCTAAGAMIPVYIIDGAKPEETGEQITEKTVNQMNAELKAKQEAIDKAAAESAAEAAKSANDNFISYADGYGKTQEYLDGVSDAFKDWLDSPDSKYGGSIGDRLFNEYSMGLGGELSYEDYISKAYEDAQYKSTHIRSGELNKNSQNMHVFESYLAKIRKHEYNSSGQEIMYEVAEGVQYGAEKYASECEKAGMLIGAKIINATREELGIASPSKEYEQIAKFSVLGFVDGILKNLNLAENASETLGDDTLASLADTIQAISSQFTDDMDTTPTIRPVLDLNNVYTGMAELDTMFSTNQARIAGSAYMTTHDDSVERLEEAYRKAIMDGNLELANMLLNSEDTNVIVDVHLDANAEGIFDLVKVENEKATKRSGASPLMIARRNAVQASLVRS